MLNNSLKLVLVQQRSNSILVNFPDILLKFSSKDTAKLHVRINSISITVL